MTTKTCKERINKEYADTMDTLRKLFAAYNADECPECNGNGNVANTDNADVEIVCKLCDGEGKLNADSYADELGTLSDYGLSFDYCGTEDDENAIAPGYFRYQISWGGPSDEFRFYAEKITPYKYAVWKIEYWFLDWYDGAKIVLTGADYKFMKEFFCSIFVDNGSAEYEREQWFSQ